MLQRRVSLCVETVLVGKQSASVILAYEIVAPLQEFEGPDGKTRRFERQDFLNREPKPLVVRLDTCLEDDGQERLVIFHSYSPSAKELRELTEDAKQYTPKSSSSPSSCSLGTVAAIQRWEELIEFDDSEYTAIPSD